MTPLDCESDYACSECQRPVCGDHEPKCSHEFPACDGCCERYHEAVAA